jgi:hypothetical protein
LLLFTFGSSDAAFFVSLTGNDDGGVIEDGSVDICSLWSADIVLSAWSDITSLFVTIWADGKGGGGFSCSLWFKNVTLGD